MGSGGGRANPDAGLPAVGGKHAGEGPLGDEELEADPPAACVVGVLSGAARRAGLVDRGADQLSDPRPEAVGADHVLGTDIDRSAGVIVPGHPDHPAVLVPLQPGHRDAGVYLGASVFGGGGEERVQQVPPRRNEEVDPGLLLDGPRDRLPSGVEGDLPDRRRTAVDDVVE
jgi:hypothetical protein